MIQLHYITRTFVIGLAYYIKFKCLLRQNSVVLVSCSCAPSHFAFLLNDEREPFRVGNIIYSENSKNLLIKEGVSENKGLSY